MIVDTQVISVCVGHASHKVYCAMLFCEVGMLQLSFQCRKDYGTITQQQQNFTFPSALLTELHLVRWGMSPEVKVGKHEQATITVVVLARDMCILARHGARLKAVLYPKMIFCPPIWDRRDVFLIQLALPLNIEIAANGPANHGKVVTAPCACSDKCWVHLTGLIADILFL